MSKRPNLSDLAADVALHETPAATSSNSGAMGLATGRREIEPSRPVTILKVDPARCRVWDAHDRDALWFNEKDCDDLISGFKSLGQQKTAIVRLVKDDPFFKYEVIEGARRRWTAEHLGMPLEVEVRNITDAQAAAMMESENADRKDISPFERAQSYDRLLEKGVFSNRESLCEVMNVSKANLAKMILTANLVKADLIGPLIKKLIPDVREISINSAYGLMQEWQKSDEIKGAIIQAANAMIASGKTLTATKVLKSLTKAPYDTPKPEKKTYFNGIGKPVLTAEKTAKGKLVFTVNEIGGGIKKADVKKLLNEALAELA